MFPFLLPPSALDIKVEKVQSANSRNKQTDNKHTEDMMDIKMSFTGQSHNDNKVIRGSYWILSFPPKHPESFAPAGNAGRAEEIKQQDIENNEQKENIVENWQSKKEK